MAQKFYLNDCLPPQVMPGVNVVDLFAKMVTGYKDMHQNKTIEVDQVWTMHDVLDNVTLCGMALRELLGQLKAKRELYGYACGLLTRGTPIIYEEESLKGDPELGQNFQFNGRSAHNLLVAQKLNMMAATLPVEKTLCKDSLELKYVEPNTGVETVRQITNWYIDNKATIEKLLTPSLPDKNQPWERLMALLRQRGKVEYSQSFEDDWKLLGSELQQLIVKRFEDALNAGLLFPANNRNMDIVKPDQRDKTSKIHELRHKGSGVRVYFECDADAIYIALYGSKTVHHGENQAADFRIAKTVAERLRRGIR